jgi:predicted RNA-binding Zn ribbon-like protein
MTIPSTDAGKQPEEFALAFLNSWDPMRPVVDLLADQPSREAFLGSWFGKRQGGRLDAGALIAARDSLRRTVDDLIHGRIRPTDVERGVQQVMGRVTWQPAPASFKAGIGFEPSTDTPIEARAPALAAFGLASLMSEYGAQRLHICASSPCEEIFVDRSKPGRQRFCGKRCANRHNIAAYRARQAG